MKLPKILSGKKKRTYQNGDENPKTLIRTGDRKDYGLSSARRSRKQMKKYWKYYDGDNTVWAAVNAIAFNTVMVGYSLESDNEEAKKVIEDFCQEVGLLNQILSSTIFALVLGDSYLEIIYKNNGEISRLKSVDPKSMKIAYDKFGDIKGYKQVTGLGEEESDLLSPKNICHINLFPRPASPYGISLIEPSRDTIDRKIRADEAIANAIVRHGTSKYVVTVGLEDEDELPSDDVLDTIKNKLEDIDEKNEFIVPYNVSIDTIDDQGIAGVDEYYSYFQAQVVVGLLCPEEALGRGTGSTEATSKTKALLWERMIRAFQMRLSYIIEHNLFNKVLENNGFEKNSVHIKFNEVTQEDEAMKAKWFGDLMKGFRTSDFKPFTINEIRQKFGFPMIDHEWADTIEYSTRGQVDNKEDDINEEKSTSRSGMST